jgi:hypothetical protein
VHSFEMGGLSLFANCLEEVFSETRFPVDGILGSSTSNTTHARKPYIWVVLRVDNRGYLDRVATIRISRKLRSVRYEALVVR